MEGSEASTEVFLESSRFWIQRVFVPIMVCIGVGGNTITVMVLTRKRMRCSTNIYLSALAIADIIYLLFVFSLSFAIYNNIHEKRYELYWRFFGLIHWLCDAASSASVWLTVSFTVERYIAVCHPIKGKVLCTENRAKSVVVLVSIFCILTTASTTFEYELAIDEDCIRNCTIDELKKLHPTPGNALHNTTIHYLPNNNIVVSNLLHNERDAPILHEIYTNLQPRLNQLLPINCSSHPHIIYVPFYAEAPPKHNANLIEKLNAPKSDSEGALNLTVNEAANDTCCLKKYAVRTDSTNLGNNRTYKTFMNWYSAIGFGLLPLVLIATFNCFLVHAVYRSQIRRRRMTNAQENVSMSNENRITVMLIGVVFLFLVCQTPTASFLIYSNFYDPVNKTADNIHRALGNLFNFLVTVNASCNFVMYCVLSKKYRATFRAIFCERKPNRQDAIVLSTTGSTQRFSSFKNGLRRNISEYRTPRNLETQSLTSIPRSKSLMVRPPGKAKSTDLNV